MVLDGLRREEQLGGGLAVGGAVGDDRGDLLLLRRQAGGVGDAGAQAAGAALAVAAVDELGGAHGGEDLAGAGEHLVGPAPPPEPPQDLPVFVDDAALVRGHGDGLDGVDAVVEKPDAAVGVAVDDGQATGGDGHFRLQGQDAAAVVAVEGGFGDRLGVVDAVDAQQRLRVDVLPRPKTGVEDVAARVDVGEHVAGAGGGGGVGGQGGHLHAAHRRRDGLDVEGVRADAQPVDVGPRQPGIAAIGGDLRAGPQQQRFEELDLVAFRTGQAAFDDVHRVGPFAEDVVGAGEPTVHPQADAFGAFGLGAVLQQLPGEHGVVVDQGQPAEGHVAPLRVEG